MHGIDPQMIDDSTFTIPWYIFIPLTVAIFIWFKAQDRKQVIEKERYREEMIAKYGSWENYERQLSAYIDEEVRWKSDQDKKSTDTKS